MPGRVVLIYPLPTKADGGSEAGAEQPGEGEAEAGHTPPCGLALVDCASRAVTRLRVSARMVMDHFVDRPPVVQALGG